MVSRVQTLSTAGIVPDIWSGMEQIGSSLASKGMKYRPGLYVIPFALLFFTLLH